MELVGIGLRCNANGDGNTEWREAWSGGIDHNRMETVEVCEAEHTIVYGFLFSYVSMFGDHEGAIS